MPFSNLISSKKRPVIVVSNDKYNKITEDIIVVAVTSNISDKEYGININNEDMKEGSLKVDSQIRVDKIYTLSKSIVVKKYGSINDNVIDEIQNILNKLVE